MQKKHVTSVRLDDFQRQHLSRLSRDDQRSVSFLINRAIDRFIEHELEFEGITRAAHEKAGKSAYARQLLEDFKPKPFRIPTDAEIATQTAIADNQELSEDPATPTTSDDPSDVLWSRINALLAEHGVTQ